MSIEGNDISDERIGELVIKEVIEEELKDVPLEEPLSLTPLTENVKTTQEKNLVDQLVRLIHIVGEKLKDDKEFQDCIKSMACSPESKKESFKEVAAKVLEGGTTWEKIAVLFYVAGQLALKMVTGLLQMVRDFFTWIVKFFKNNLLGWIQDHGGWINCISCLGAA